MDWGEIPAETRVQTHGGMGPTRQYGKRSAKPGFPSHVQNRTITGGRPRRRWKRCRSPHSQIVSGGGVGVIREIQLGATALLEWNFRLGSNGFQRRSFCPKRLSWYPQAACRAPFAGRTIHHQDQSTHTTRKRKGRRKKTSQGRKKFSRSSTMNNSR